MNYKDSKVLITGGTGFIGKNLKKCLVDNGFTNVFAVGSKDYNLLNVKDVHRMFDEINPDIVVNLAAKVGGIADIKEHPADFYYENMFMCTQILYEANLHKVKKFVAVGTNCSYPENIAVPFKETDLFSGYPQMANAPYGIVKRAFYQQCLSFEAQYGQKFIYLIPTNAYGVDDHFDEQSGHVIPSLIKKFKTAILTDSTVTLWGSGKATREFMYIDDVSKCIMQAILKYDSNKPLNIGTGIETSIKELANTIAQLTGYKKEIIWDTTKPEGYLRKCLDNQQMKKHLGFSSFVPLNDGLKRTIEWAEQNKII